MTAVEEELRRQFVAAFEGADYPVETQMDLLPALPDGPGTRFEAGEISLTAMQLAMHLNGHQDFPYDTVEALVEDIMTGLRAEGIL